MKLEQPDDDDNNIVLRMVDEINDTNCRIIDIGSELTGDIHDDIRDEGVDVDMVPSFSVSPLQMPVSDSLLPATTRDNEELSLSSNERQPQVQ